MLFQLLLAVGAAQPPASGEAGCFGVAMAGVGRIGDHPALAVASWNTSDGASVRVHDLIDSSQAYAVAWKKEEGMVLRLLALDDIDADEKPDWACSLPSPWDRQASGRVEVHSGASGALIASIDAGEKEFGIGGDLAACPDQDADGKADLLVLTAVGAPSSGGRVRIISTKSFRTIRDLTLPVPAESSSAALLLVKAGETTGVAIGVRPNRGGLQPVVLCLALADGRELWRTRLPDGDGGGMAGLWGLGEQAPGLLVIGSSSSRTTPPGIGRVHLVSAGSGELLKSLSDGKPGFGSGVAILEHRTGDIPARMAVAVYKTFLESTQIDIFALPLCERTEVLRFPKEVHREDDDIDDELNFAANLANVGDVDGDKFDDLAVAGFNPATPNWAGYVLIYSGREMKLLRRIDPVPRAKNPPLPR